jgi:hypothetical protein
MGKGEPSMRLTTERSGCGHDAGGPSGDVDQSFSRSRRAISL